MVIAMLNEGLADVSQRQARRSCLGKQSVVLFVLSFGAIDEHESTWESTMSDKVLVMIDGL